ncbi:MAG TPA: hypothetical protein VL359_01985 [bacterium]|nr:hypothetical protein [bacterium]
MKPRGSKAQAAGLRSRLIAAGALLLALAAAWLPSVPGVPSRTTRVWRGYETLLLGPQAVRSGRLARLVQEMGPGVVSELTASVSFWDFTGVDRAAVSRLDERIDPRDPRHDRVMDDLGGYFRAPAGRLGTWTVVFLPARRAPVLDYIRVARLLGAGAGAWRLVEMDPVEAFAALAGMFAFALFLTRSSPRGERLTRTAASAAAAALWMPFVLGGGLERLALSFLLLFTWYRAADVVISLHGWDKRLRKNIRSPLVALAASTGAGLLLLVPAGGFAAGALAAFVGPVAGSVLLLAALALYWGRSRRPVRRRKFTPVPIVTPALSVAPGPAGVLLALAALTTVAVIPLARSVPVPTPVALRDVRDFSWKALDTLARSGHTPRLPDLADLVTHEAFQETIAFGRPWGLPRRDEHVAVRGFLAGPGGTIVAVERRVKVFDDAWLASCLRGAPPGSIEALLAAQGRAVVVGLRGSARALARELPLAVLVIALFFAWLARAPQTARSVPGLAPLMKGVLLRFNGAARRSQTP